MSTNYSPSRNVSPDSLYAGRDKGRPLGEVLKRMVREGRVVSRGQKERWQESREFYRGNQGITFNSDQRLVNQLARNSNIPPGQMGGMNTYNRLRQMVDGRVALLVKNRPPYEVIPEDNDADSIDAADQAESFLDARWGRAGWNIQARLAELIKNGDIDGIAWLYVGWDPNAGEDQDTLVATHMDGTPITDRNEYETLKAEDPMMTTLWKMGTSDKPLGDVVWRVVLPGAISVDPFAIKNFDSARWIIESEIMPRSDYEKAVGMSYKDAIKSSALANGDSSITSVMYEDVAVDDGQGGSKISEQDGVLIHHFYAKEGPDWPNGACIVFADRAPSVPLKADKWDGDLPYFCFIPRPDPGHFIRSRSVTDDLKPLQKDYNQTIRDTRQWMKKVAQMPMAIPRGALVTDSIYNERGYFEYHPALGEPHYASTPPEPTAILTNELMRIVNEMREIAGISAAAQGLAAVGTHTTSMAIQSAIQQTEQNLGEIEANFVEAIEWGCTRSLQLVKENYSIARTVQGIGVDDAERFRAFTGAMIRGSGRMRVTGPLMPKSKAMQMNSIAQFAPILGADKLLPYIGGLIEGDPTELQTDVERAGQHQKGETREMVGLVANPTALKVYQNFESDKQAFAQAANAAQQAGNDPQQALMAAGIQPPQLTPMLIAAGIDVPLVEDFNNHPMELKALDDFRNGDAYKKLHPMAKQLLREHAAAHKQQLAQQVQAMAQQQPMGQQQGSAGVPKGTPSPPRGSAPSPGGM